MGGMSRAAVRRLEPTDCRVRVDGVEVAARAGETVAATLLASGGWTAFHCGMGACFACVVTIDGERGRRACVELTHPGMVVQTGLSGAGNAAADPANGRQPADVP
jgi:predicted molibdopterin-dependent oxidoreductase YjgC